MLVPVGIAAITEASPNIRNSPVAVLSGLDAKSKAVPLKFNSPLNKIAPGEYICQITVLNPTDQKAAFWQAQVMLIP